jgi:hypothetical protein
MDILVSARKHGVSDDDIRHAIEHAWGGVTSEERPEFTMLIGPDLAANLLEVGVLGTDDDEFVIDAMRARPQYLKILSEREKQ